MPIDKNFFYFREKIEKINDQQVFEQFKLDFPNADYEFFEDDFGKIYFNFTDENSYAIDSDYFWKHPEAVKHLNLTGDDVYRARVWKEKFPKAKRIIASEKKK